MRCVGVRVRLTAGAARFTTRAEVRNTKTLELPVMLLTGTRSCALINTGVSHITPTIIAERATRYFHILMNINLSRASYKKSCI
jgi:hypothetical protein